MVPRMGLYRLLRPLLFAVPPDLVHDGTQWALRRALWRRLRLGGTPDESLATTLGDVALPHPVGLAAGFDKNGEITAAMAALGFAFAVVGSVRPTAHPGNPRPWFARRATEEGLVNAMGLPSRGAAHVRRRLESRGAQGFPVLLSLAGESPAEFREVHDALAGIPQGWEVNVSCPNTATGRTFEEDPRAFELLLRQLPRPTATTFLKFSPYEAEADRDRTLELASRAIRLGFRCFTLCNTLPVVEARVRPGRGGLSGRPLLPYVLQALRDFRGAFGDGVHLVGVGGVTTGRDAFELLEAGAEAVQVLTALILRGPLAALHIRRELQEILRAQGLRSLEEVVGRAAE